MHFIAKVPNDGDEFFSDVRTMKFDDNGIKKVELEDPEQGTFWEDAENVKLYKANQT